MAKFGKSPTGSFNPKKNKTLPDSPTAAGSLEGWVSGVFSHKCLVWHGGTEYLCLIKGQVVREERLVAGDRVVFMPEPGGKGAVQARLPRTTLLTRAHPDPHRRGQEQGQPLAANVELLVIAAAIQQPPFHQGLVERLLVAAAKTGLEPLLAVTKVDLDTTGAFPQWAAYYQHLGVKVVGLSHQHPASLIALRDSLAGRVAVLVGHSGVGKTTLTNQLCGAALATGTVGEQGQGRHTTTAARLLPLPDGGFLVDSPGVRAFGLHDVAPQDLARYFRGLGGSDLACGFRDCLHRQEPRCAVRASLSSPESADRYARYLSLLKEVEENQPAEAW
ncbi:MAG: ribosome small subunit-dependent GTPase A [Deltaproteobacteria bacterium]|nr:ribosome small subunit-dependent GTPase A [Deltaproteobacteria bacterium]